MQVWFKILLVTCFLFGFQLMEAQVRVSFIVKSKPKLPSTENVFIDGDHPYLMGTQMTKMSEGAWLMTFRFNRYEQFSFKFTRGKNGTDGLNNRGEIIRGFIDAKRDTVIDVTIYKWQDGKGTLGSNARPTTSTTKPTTSTKPKDTLPTDPLGPDRNPEFDAIVEPPPKPPFVNLRELGDMQHNGSVPRNIKVWLPDSYETDEYRHYPVLYVHDGLQMKYSKKSFSAYDWHVIGVVDSLIDNRAIQDIIVVEINNRYDSSFSNFSENLAKRYRNFLVEYLKPHIDREYRTLPEPYNTASMGSDVAGLVAFLLSWENPEVFGKAICLSPVFDFEKQYYTFSKRILEDNKPYRNIKLYFDNGSETVGAKRKQEGINRMMRALQQKGYYVDFYEDYGDYFYKSQDWAKRVYRPIMQFF